MKQGHTPFGYRIAGGKAVIDDEDAGKVRLIFTAYLDGQSMTNAAGQAGLKLMHASVKRILTNRHYLGDDFYPTIIDTGTFDAAQKERKRREESLGRDNLPKKKPDKWKPPIKFRMGKAVRTFDEPYKQAEYLYSLIESED